MSDFTSIDGNPSETVGSTRIASAEEADDRMRLHLSPRRLIEVLRDHLQSTHVLIALFVGLAAEAIAALLAESAFPRVDLTWMFAGMSVVLLVVCSGLFFAVLHGGESDDGEDEPSATLTIDANRFEIAIDRWFGRRTALEGEAWEFLETLRRLERSRVAPSTRVVASLRPTASLRSFLVAGLTEEDRRWLVRQFEIEV